MITLLIALRLIPYIFSAVIAYQKGFNRLAVVACLGICSVTLALTLPEPPPLSLLISSIFSIAVLFHALDLKSRKGSGN